MVFDNLLYIKAYGVDLSGYYISVVINTEQHPYRFILKKGETSGDLIFIDFPDGTENVCYKKENDQWIAIGYKWSSHTNDISMGYERSHIKILDSIHSTDSMIESLNAKIYDSAEKNTILRNDTDNILNNVNDYLIDTNGIVTNTFDGAYINPNNNSIRISSTTYMPLKCTVYSVSAGSVYRFKADNYRLNETLPAVVFTTTNVLQTNTVLENPSVLYEADTTLRNVDFIYHCHQDGYVVAAWKEDCSELKMYTTIILERYNSFDSRITALERTTDDLSGKTIAILGDSIMMQQRTNYSGTNTVSYLGSDGNTYTFDQLTNINGKLYVTTDNTISCTNVNSNQSKLDIQNWDALKDATGAADVINCGMSGATLKEKQIITAYPYHDDGKTNCLSNEVRMLKRIVQGGRSIPDCIVVWLGTNDANDPFGNDNYDEIMQLDYSILADDTLGREYRQTIYGSLRYSLEALCREYPYATIIVFTPIQTQRVNRTYGSLTTIGNALKKMADRYSCICVNGLTDIGIVDLLEPSGSNGVFLADGLHPNSDGKKLLANFTAKKLNTLYFSKR